MSSTASNSGGSNSSLQDFGRVTITSILIRSLIGILIFLFLIRLCLLFYRRFYLAAAPATIMPVTRPNGQQPQEGNHGENNAAIVAINFDAIISTCPSFLYTKDADTGEDPTCVICLSEYVESEMIRKMPQCGHYFHLNCLDQWLKINRSCPVCRDTPSIQAGQSPLPVN